MFQLHSVQGDGTHRNLALAASTGDTDDDAYPEVPQHGTLATPGQELPTCEGDCEVVQNSVIEFNFASFSTLLALNPPNLILDFSQVIS